MNYLRFSVERCVPRLALWVLCLFLLNACAFVPKSIRDRIESLSLNSSTSSNEQGLVINNDKSSWSYMQYDLSTVLANDDSSKEEFDSRFYFIPPVKIHRSKVNSIEALPNSNGVFTGGQDGNIFEIVPEYVEHSRRGEGVSSELRTKFRLLAKSPRPILALSVSSDGKYLAVAQFSLVSIINLSNRKVEAQFNRVKGRILSLEWGAKNSHLLLGRANGDVFNWNIGEDVTRASDSTNALELYETEPSPVVGIVLHPSGRAFFVALQGGGVYLVRLLRTEQELGLKDSIRPSGMTQGKFVVPVGRVLGQINDMDLDQKSEELIVSGSEGKIYRWRLRGLRSLFSYPTGSDSTGFISLIHPKNTTFDVAAYKRPLPILSTLGRNLRIRFWCAKDSVYERVEPTQSVFLEEEEEDDSLEDGFKIRSSEDQMLEKLKQEMLSELSSDSVSTNEPNDLSPGLIAETPRFIEPAMAGRYARGSGILWIGEKSGNLIGFDVSSFLSSAPVQLQLRNVCKLR